MLSMYGSIQVHTALLLATFVVIVTETASLALKKKWAKKRKG